MISEQIYRRCALFVRSSWKWLNEKLICLQMNQSRLLLNHRSHHLLLSALNTDNIRFLLLISFISFPFMFVPIQKLLHYVFFLAQGTKECWLFVFLPVLCSPFAHTIMIAFEMSREVLNRTNNSLLITPEISSAENWMRIYIKPQPKYNGTRPKFYIWFYIQVYYL